MAKLTDKQQRFVEEYLIDMNATQAAIRAGYSVKTADVIGSENLVKPNIAEAIKEAQQKTSQKLEVTRENALEILLRMQATNEYVNPNASLKAMDMVIKMLGLNEPIKTDVTTNGKDIQQEIKISIIKPKE